MSRPTRIYINTAALVHNVARVREFAPGKKIIAMVKANAYGCGLSAVWPSLDALVDAFGVACIEEAIALRDLGCIRDCVLFQGVFSADELPQVAAYNLQCVIHHAAQLAWILATPLNKKIKVWIKVNTGMNRLGFNPSEVLHVMRALLDCPWIDPNIGLMTHLASSDEPNNPSNQLQLDLFNALDTPHPGIHRSIANSGAILSMPNTHADTVRPGIMLYGVSPFANQTGHTLGLLPVMQFVSVITAIHHCNAHERVGYGGVWQSDKPTIIGVVAVGYGDGYPRHVAENTPTWVNDQMAPIVGRVSMDMLTINLTDCPGARVGDAVELWGAHIPVEVIAKAAGTIAYELICQVSPRVRPTI